VHSDGALEIERRDEISRGHLQWTHNDGKGGSRKHAMYAANGGTPKQQGPARRWSYVPWTSAQEESCKPASLVVTLKVNLKRKLGTNGGGGSNRVVGGTEEKDPKRKKMNRLLKELQ
jgi:hypothetical protein